MGAYFLSITLNTPRQTAEPILCFPLFSTWRFTTFHSPTKMSTPSTVSKPVIPLVNLGLIIMILRVHWLLFLLDTDSSNTIQLNQPLESLLGCANSIVQFGVENTRLNSGSPRRVSKMR